MKDKKKGEKTEERKMKIINTGKTLITLLIIPIIFAEVGIRLYLNKFDQIFWIMLIIGYLLFFDICYKTIK